MVQSAHSLGFSVHKFSVICAFVWEIQSAKSISLAFEPLAVVVEIFSQLIWRQKETIGFGLDLWNRHFLINLGLQLPQRPWELIQRRHISWSMSFDNRFILRYLRFKVYKGISILISSYFLELLNFSIRRLLTTATSHFQLYKIQYSKLYRITIISFQISMEQLNRLIKDASNQFECHNFQTSLSLYVRCIQKCVEGNLPKYVLYNLKSSEAALRTILGEYETALSILNEVLKEEKQHWLSLIRRSQVYKKQNKFKKAMKDLDILTMYAPDNMQVVALKLELKGLMSKPTGSSSQSSSGEDEDNVDEQQVLKFSNLRKIDRTSVSIMLPKGRQSRVTISGDKSFFYESAPTQNKQRIRQSKSYTPSFNCKRFIQIDKQLQQTNPSEKQLPAVVIKTKSTPGRTKSILRNRDSKIYVADKLDPETQSQQKKLIEKVQDIDGVVIKSISNISSSQKVSQRQVGFRKSLFADQPVVQVLQGKTKAKPAARKSCLKRSSFSNIVQEVQKKGPRTSKFESMSRSSIDGRMIKSDKKRVQADNQASKQNIQVASSSHNNDSGDQSDEGSQYNIFGSKKVVLNQQLRENLGLGSDSIVEESETNVKKVKQRGQSILKKTSIIVKKDAPKQKASVFFKQKQEEKDKTERKAKKSVMFKG